MDSEHPIEQATADEQRAEAELASLLARLQHAAPAAGRLARVRHAIARGEFHVDAHAIAERMLARWLTS
jgi:anti-sigma28 factor (negative regulator of flagellin synthesis)